ncbi:hypothetical protein [Flavobacterium xanthum]|uniref:hypothetical protein n=1 Tax=Flavobacterium xanthum TaxID=69322 RepID=UPI001114D370|nr:hypothetical protein [Flavobacterium xanthum]
MQKKEKIKPENQKLENYHEVPFRSRSRSSSTRGLLPFHFFVVLLCFLFKGGERRLQLNVYWFSAVFVY